MADIFDVIADSTRRDILRLLLDRDAHSETTGTSVSQIVSELGVSQPTVSKHLKVLREAELVRVREEGQHRFYSIDAAPLAQVEDWIMPFTEASDDALLEAAGLTDTVMLPESAAHAADFVGRTAASLTHAVSNVFRKRVR